MLRPLRRCGSSSSACRGALVGQCHSEGQGGVVEREGGGARHRAGHVGDAVVHHVVDDVGRIGVRGGAAGLEAAALVDGDVHHHRAGLHHACSISRVTSFGAAAPGTSTAPITRSALQTCCSMASLVGEHACCTRPAKTVVELAQPVEVDVEHRDVGAQAHGHARGIGADDAAADHHDLGRRHARHAAQQHAAAALRLLQAVGAGLDRHAAGDFAHRRQQRQAAGSSVTRLVGDRDAARLPAAPWSAPGRGARCR